MTLVIAVFAGAFGLAIGSFITVVATRVPAGLSIVKPGSTCPHCGGEIAWRDNIPVVSWLLLRGRCRNCQASISPRYPLIEAVTAASFVVATVFLGPTLWLLVTCLAWSLVITSVAMVSRDRS